MREILFRVKDEATNEWIYGFPSVFDGEEFMYFFSPEKNGQLRTHVERLKTLGQYTGMNDKKGNKVFEGDILQFVFGKNKDLTVNYRVDFKFGEFTLISDSGGEIFIARAAECEVVGNIYDNP